MSVLITFIQKAIMQGICMLFGADGEILTEKSGNLNLGVPGMMYMGGIAGLMAAFYYEKLAAHPNGLVGMILSLLAAFLMAAFGGSSGGGGPTGALCGIPPRPAVWKRSTLNSSGGSYIRAAHLPGLPDTGKLPGNTPKNLF